MQTTDNRGYPYPECNPPLVKDASDIEQMRDLALAIDTDIGTLDARLADFLEKPDAARMTLSSTVVVPSTTGDFTFTLSYNTTDYDNTGVISDTAIGGLRLRESGLYLFTSAVRLTHASIGVSDLALTHAVNGSFGGVRRYEGPSGNMTTGSNGDTAMTTSHLVMCKTGDVVQTSCQIVALAATYSVTAALACLQLLHTDI